MYKVASAISIFTLLKRILLLGFILAYSLNVAAQADTVIINNINFIGNKKTHDRIILYEMDIEKGDKVPLEKLNNLIKLEEKRILNTRLFSFVKINIKNWNQKTNRLDIEVNLHENWYIFPSLIFELADRNFNVWWQEQNRSFKRVNYGARIDHYNLTGNKDKLKLKLQFGYARKFELKYSFPYIKNGWGLGINLFYSDQKEIGYITQGNKTIFAKTDDERILLHRFRTNISVSKRSGLFLFYSVNLSYHRNTIDEYVAQDLNPDYFLNGASRLSFFRLEYDVDYDKRVFIPYPEGGFRLRGNIAKDGFGFEGDYNNLSLTASIEKYWKIKGKLIVETRLKGKTNIIRDRIAYANNTALGYSGNVITGYELYVIDGTDWFIQKNALKYALLDKVFHWDWLSIQQFKKVSIKVWLRWNVDFGYVKEETYIETNTLNNQWLVGYGPSLDFLLFNNLSLQIEYGINEIGDHGFYLKGKLDF